MLEPAPDPTTPEGRARIDANRSAYAEHLRTHVERWSMRDAFAFEPSLRTADPPQQGGPEPWGRTTASTRVLACPESEDVYFRRGRDPLRSSCPVVASLDADAVVRKILRFPDGRTVVLVLEDESLFVDVATRRVVFRDDWIRPYLIGDITFTPRGRMLVRWSAGSCLGESMLRDERGRSVPCARSGELSSDHRYAVTVDHYGTCAADWTNAHSPGMIEVVDLDTCRTIERPVMPSEAARGSEVAFGRHGVVVRFEAGRRVALAYP